MSLSAYMVTGITFGCINSLISFFGVLAHFLVEYSFYTALKYEGGTSLEIFLVLALNFMDMHIIKYMLESSKHCSTLFNSIKSIFVTPPTPPAP